MRLLSSCLLAVLLLLGASVPAWGDVVSQADLDSTLELWQDSIHALNDVNCSSCHQDAETKDFIARPTQESCQSCHEQAVETFLLGKHGVRLLEGQTPLMPKMARLPMQPAARDKPMTCNTCHDVHSVDTVRAAVDSCLTCHSDSHSLNYQNSKHAQLFEKDRRLPRPSRESVSCATCHLPRHSIEQSDGEVTWVNHNNTFTLKPRDRMVKEVCMNCHGVEYSYNSIFDDALVEANFDKPPSLSLQTFDLVRALEARRSTGK
ncbi:MAG: cytochrome c3 family protein [Cyanobacteria bacterium SID2]|nr:cytochrome c3 family protein [Cyanobacteria bacterium SID2]MBP0003756.1 cytochrome c3 family protein [Cyanobacteria bacterium SBC]